jgi:hypothetical protein
VEQRGQELREAIAQLGRRRRNDPVPESLAGRGPGLRGAASQAGSELAAARALGLGTTALEHQGDGRDAVANRTRSVHRLGVPAQPYGATLLPLRPGRLS